MTDYAQIAKDSRLKVLDMVYKAQTSHIGSLMGAADIFAVLFEKMDLDKDKFVLSAGWKAALLYYHLWRKGRITLEQLDSYCMEGSEFIGLAEPIIPDIPIAGGSMGLGLPGAVGLALAKKIKKEEGTIYVLMSDGELQIGTFWESVLIAGHHKLSNLVVIVDNNGLQAMGKTEDILKGSQFGLSSLDMIKSADWTWIVSDGNTHSAIESCLEKQHPNCPLFILLNTVKGAGVSFMEENNLYHYKQLSEEEYEKAKAELHG